MKSVVILLGLTALINMTVEATPIGGEEEKSSEVGVEKRLKELENTRQERELAKLRGENTRRKRENVNQANSTNREDDVDELLKQIVASELEKRHSRTIQEIKKIAKDVAISEIDKKTFTTCEIGRTGLINLPSNGQIKPTNVTFQRSFKTPPKVQAALGLVKRNSDSKYVYWNVFVRDIRTTSFNLHLQTANGNRMYASWIACGMR